MIHKIHHGKQECQESEQIPGAHDNYTSLTLCGAYNRQFSFKQYIYKAKVGEKEGGQMKGRMANPMNSVSKQSA
jgi:hypothetical protein